ncbi:16S rRNA (adenine(1518)-N(6)/adenine(1519)-N(6))-dimethyltransferase RsmA [Megalodesulfovibrio gigas]|uniref:Ribosomal RNA small subunit methyltransferase A n=1 Tax=Megalodesulfovibrio gigas (strain ATCC 19364 / DSM 1382 / NCIMB 9332 / VKM B-1759) TaxID=1121448 RepID=T2GEC0_MEGG1|nr:16S rRNA (adenine(1518)-N(6)/adenine(1519)-N(6))-dimethyltransferase RsmA [Megalodesulfovibrio gigas]AGW14252.1 putative dimethyladenosine transferase [Megalodesulfovibrio gigas DSM 1382 = ATCC 19364]
MHIRPSSPHPRAKKSLGQHFLHDVNTARRIASLLEIGPDDTVLEIGPGTGALTRHLIAAAPRRLICLEKDRELAPLLKTSHPDVDVVLMDAMQAPWDRLGAACPGLKIAGNLPYNVASPLMWDCIARTPGFERAVFMIQKEVARRIVAPPGGKEYGALTVWLQAFATVEYAFTVGPGVFTPRPKVDSGVIVLRPRPLNLHDLAPAGPAELAAVVRRCFQQRRKQLGTILRGYIDESVAGILAADGILLTARPETLAVSQFLTLAKCLGRRFAP